MNYVGFKGLGLDFTLNRIALSIFGLNIYWYGIIIALAFFVGLTFLIKRAKNANFSQDALLDLIIIATPVSIICARLYYVLFKFEDYKYDLTEMFKIWHGGIAIYGGIIGAIGTTIIYCRIKKLPIWQILDMVAPSFAIAQAIGRWGNFVNVEAYGRETTLPWGMTILENGIYKTVHPTFLYESLWNLAVFLILLWYYNRRKHEGEVFLIYIGLYSAGRFWIEGLRTDSLYLGMFRISQILAMVLIIFSIGMLWFWRVRRNNNVEKSI